MVLAIMIITGIVIVNNNYNYVEANICYEDKPNIKTYGACIGFTCYGIIKDNATIETLILCNEV